MRVSARKILALPQKEVNELLTGHFDLVFDNGTVVSNYKEVMYDSYVWEFHRRYPGAPIVVSHHLSSVLKNTRLSASTHLKFIGVVLWDIYDFHSKNMDEQEKLKFRYDLAELAYRITNNIYNDMVVMTEEYAGSLDILDFHNILHDEDVSKSYDALPAINSSIDDIRIGIDNIYNTINKVLTVKESVKNNPLSQLMRSSLVSSKQLNQCLGPRGFLTDTGSNMYVRPVLRGYVEGLRLFYNSIVESQSAAKSLEFSKSPLQDSEYFARRLQLISMSVENLHYEDCNTGRYLRWKVQGEEFANGVKVYGGDLKNMVGKYYLDEETNKLKAIKASDTHLIGKVIQLRSVFKCMHTDPKGICAICFGQLYESVPPDSNIGHMCATYMCEQASQLILSVKHLDGSSVVDVIILADGDKAYLRVCEDGSSYGISRNLKSSKISLIIPSRVDDKPVNLSDIYDVDDVRKLILSHVSEITHVGLMVTDKDGVIERHDSEVSIDRRLASLTYELLGYVREHGWTVDELGNYVIDMSGWDWEKPILTLPLKHFNMSDHSNAIAALLEGKVKDMHKRDKEIPPEEIFQELFRLTNRRLSVNFAALEVIFYANMVVSSTDRNYELPKPWTTAGLGVMEKTMAGRSEAVGMAYEDHFNIITDPASFINKNRPDHPFDAILMPREVITSGSRKR